MEHWDLIYKLYKKALFEKTWKEVEKKTKMQILIFNSTLTKIYFANDMAAHACGLEDSLGHTLETQKLFNYFLCKSK